VNGYPALLNIILLVYVTDHLHHVTGEKFGKQAAWLVMFSEASDRQPFNLG